MTSLQYEREKQISLSQASVETYWPPIECPDAACGIVDLVETELRKLILEQLLKGLEGLKGRFRDLGDSWGRDVDTLHGEVEISERL